eukprot:7435008-Alexandrium_andersonii.AAC.1
MAQPGPRASERWPSLVPVWFAQQPELHVSGQPPGKRALALPLPPRKVGMTAPSEPSGKRA